MSRPKFSQQVTIQIPSFLRKHNLLRIAVILFYLPGWPDIKLWHLGESKGIVHFIKTFAKVECPFTRYASRSWLQFHIIYGILIIWYYEFRVLSDPENLVRDTLGRVPKSKIGFGRYWTFPCTFKLSRQSVDQLRQENLYLVWLKECLVPSLKIKTVPGILRVPSHAAFETVS